MLPTVTHSWHWCCQHPSSTGWTTGTLFLLPQLHVYPMRAWPLLSFKDTRIRTAQIYPLPLPPSLSAHSRYDLCDDWSCLPAASGAVFKSWVSHGTQLGRKRADRRGPSKTSFMAPRVTSYCLLSSRFDTRREVRGGAAVLGCLGWYTDCFY